MTKTDVARIALGMVIGAVAAVAITQASSTNAALMRWLVYCVVAGVLINPPAGYTLASLLIGGIISSTGMLGALGWIAFLNHGVIPNFSLVRLDLVNETAFGASILSSLFLVSVFGVTIGGLARSAILEVLERLSTTDPALGRNIQAWINTAVVVAGAGWLLLS
jgi:hypothetical protein